MENNMEYILIHYYSNFEGGGGVEVEYYDTYDAALKASMQGDTIAKVIEEIK